MLEKQLIFGQLLLPSASLFDITNKKLKSSRLSLMINRYRAWCERVREENQHSRTLFLPKSSKVPPSAPDDLITDKLS